MSDEEYGEEDFENYDDDFDADEDYDVLPKAMLANTAAATPETNPASPAIRPSSRGGMGIPTTTPYTPPRVVNIPPAPPLTDAQRTVARKRLAASLKKFKKLELQEVVPDELLCMGSLSEYELFTMGRSMYAGKKVGTAQTNDDAKEEECQTMEIDTLAYASQAPEDRNQMTDSEVQASSVTASAPGQKQTAPPPEVARATAAMTRLTQMEPGVELKLNAFMQWAGPIVLAALGIAPNSKKITLQSDPTGGKGISSGIVPMSHTALLSNRPVNSLAFIPTGGEPLLLAAYGPVGAQLGAEQLLKDHTLATKGCMCVWDLSAPSAPKAVLISEGTPSCCGFVPSPATNIVFAGMEEGGLCLWDLEESEARHPQEQVGGTRITTRRPAYTTECRADLSTSAEPIVSVVAVPRSSRATPCYLYTLSAWGSVTVWTVNAMSAAEAASLDLELGMRQGSKVRLLRVVANVRIGNAALKPQSMLEDSSILSGLVQASSLQALPQNHHHFLVAGDGGRVLKGSWAGLASAPKEYVAHDHTAAALLQGTGRLKLPSCVTSLHVSPICPWAFLAGHDDGTVTLHGLSLSTAAAVWPGAAGGAVKAVRWSPTRPCVFFVLDAMCTLSCFDLTQNRSAPVHTQSFMTADPKQPGVASLATSLEVGQISQAADGAEQLPGFTIGYDDGRVDFLAFAPAFVKPGSGETQLLVDIVGPDKCAGSNRRPQVSVKQDALACAQCVGALSLHAWQTVSREPLNTAVVKVDRDVAALSQPLLPQRPMGLPAAVATDDPNPHSAS